jgi:hypothetical protein
MPDPNVTLSRDSEHVIAPEPKGVNVSSSSQVACIQDKGRALDAGPGSQLGGECFESIAASTTQITGALVLHCQLIVWSGIIMRCGKTFRF